MAYLVIPSIHGDSFHVFWIEKVFFQKKKKRFFSEEADLEKMKNNDWIILDVI